MNYRTIELKTESRSVQAPIYPSGQVVSVGATRQNDAPWPPATVAVPANLVLDDEGWARLVATVDALFIIYRQKFEGMVIGKLSEKEKTDPPELTVTVVED